MEKTEDVSFFRFIPETFSIQKSSGIYISCWKNEARE